MRGLTEVYCVRDFKDRGNSSRCEFIRDVEGGGGVQTSEIKNIQQINFRNIKLVVQTPNGVGAYEDYPMRIFCKEVDDTFGKIITCERGDVSEEDREN